jgi:cation:H+ antiporter
LLGYIFGVRLISCDQRVSQVQPQADRSRTEGTTKSWRSSAIGFLVAAAAIVVSGPYLAESAGQLADLTGLGKSFVGTTLVAFSTSLPELVASIAALRMGAHDLAIGNVFGSNAFNMVLLIPLDIAHDGSILSAVSRGHALTCIAAVIATLIVVLGQLYQVEKRWRLIEPDATLVVVVVFGALWLIYQTG